MKESDVILAPLFQSDLEPKYRPAIILREMQALTVIYLYVV